MFWDALPMVPPFILRAPGSIPIPGKRLFKGLRRRESPPHVTHPPIIPTTSHVIPTTSRIIPTTLSSLPHPTTSFPRRRESPEHRI